AARPPRGPRSRPGRAARAHPSRGADGHGRRRRGARSAGAAPTALASTRLEGAADRSGSARADPIGRLTPLEAGGGGGRDDHSAVWRPARRLTRWYTFAAARTRG